MTQVADGVFVRGVVDSECYVYNAGTLAWVPMTQPSGGAGGGDASAANQVLGNASLSSIDTKLTNPLPVSGTFYQVTQPVSLASMPSTPVTGTFYQVTQPVSIASMPSTPVTGTFFQGTQPVSATALPLPTGASTEATQLLQATATGQTTGNTSLASLDTKTPALITDSLGIGRSPVDLEASDYDIGGIHVINVIDRQQRRMHEQDQLDAYVARMQAIIACEWESSHRMGFELR